MCVCAKSLQLCWTLCDLMDYGPPGSLVLGILQARIEDWVPMPSSKGSFWSRDGLCVSCSSFTVGVFFTDEPLGKPHIPSILSEIKFR